jgi:hypothetical protein
MIHALGGLRRRITAFFALHPKRQSVAVGAASGLVVLVAASAAGHLAPVAQVAVTPAPTVASGAASASPSPSLVPSPTMAASPSAKPPAPAPARVAAPVAKSCTQPRYVLPLNPSNPQDGRTLSGFYVATDTWNAAHYQVAQTLYICDYNNWYAVANMNNSQHDGAVKTYPNVHKDFDSAPRISSYHSITSSFAHSAPHVGIYEFAYDIWLNGVAGNGSTEVMIWTDNFGQTPAGSQVATVSFDGRSYRVYKTGSYIAFVDSANTTAGNVNLLAFFNYLISKGWITAGSTLGQIDYGPELVSTNGTNATFAVTNFTLDAR